MKNTGPDFPLRTRTSITPPRGSVAPPDEVLTQLSHQVATLGTKLDSVLDALSRASKPLLTVEEFAKATGRSAYTIRRWITQQNIAATRVNGTGPRGRLLISRDQLDLILAQGRGGAVAAVDLSDSKMPAPSRGGMCR